MTEAVVDNTLLSNFAHLEQFRLLHDVFDPLVSVPTVFRALSIGVELGRVSVRDWSASASPIQRFMLPAVPLSNAKYSFPNGIMLP